MRYTVATKGGREYKAKTVTPAMGFMTLEVWDGEIRLPSSEILWVKKTLFTSAITDVKKKDKAPEPDSSSKHLGCKSCSWTIPLVLFILVFVFAFLRLLAYT